MESKFKIGRYYNYKNSREVFKCINKEKSIYLFKIVDGDKFGEAKCPIVITSSKLCKECNNKTVCTRNYIKDVELKEIPYLKAILLYET